jgi:hypothetical protein
MMRLSLRVAGDKEVIDTRDVRIDVVGQGLRLVKARRKRRAGNVEKLRCLAVFPDGATFGIKQELSRCC